MKRAESIIIGKDGDLERKEFHSVDVEDGRGRTSRSVFYRVQIVEGTILVQECQSEVLEKKNKKTEEVEVVTKQWAFYNRKAEITFSSDDPEEDEDSEGFDLLFGSPSDDFDAEDFNDE